MLAGWVHKERRGGRGKDSQDEIGQFLQDKLHETHQCYLSRATGSWAFSFLCVNLTGKSCRDLGTVGYCLQYLTSRLNIQISQI